MISPPNRFAVVGDAVIRSLRTRQAAPGAVVLAYHDVVGDEEGLNEWVVGVDRLRTHVTTLRRLGLTIVPLSDIVDRLTEGQSVDGLAALTFDDALLGVHKLAAPLLAELDAPATVFVVSDVLGTEPAWWPESGPVMSLAAVQELHAAGWTIGAHCRTHPSLPSLNDEQLVSEIGESGQQLRALGLGEVEFLAYPYGHFNAAVRATVSDAGFRAAFTFLNGRVTPGLDPFRLPRLTMGVHSSALRLAYHLFRDAGSWPDHQLDASSVPLGY